VPLVAVPPMEEMHSQRIRGVLGAVTVNVPETGPCSKAEGVVAQVPAVERVPCEAVIYARGTDTVTSSA